MTVNSEAAAHQADVLRNRCSLKFRNVQRKHLCWSLFLIKLQACNFPVNIAKFLRPSFNYKTHPVAASKKFINLPGKHEWRRRNRFIFLKDTTE